MLLNYSGSCRGKRSGTALFHGSQREVSTVIIGCEADFLKVKRRSREEVAKPMRDLRDYFNLSYESEATLICHGTRIELRDGL